MWQHRHLDTSHRWLPKAANHCQTTSQILPPGRRPTTQTAGQRRTNRCSIH